MKKKTALLIAAAAAVYVILLLLLAWFEQAADGGSINSFGDAFWYSLVTMTTVGYGDLYPVSLPGRIIGFVFLLASIGVLASVILALASVIRERFMPFIRMQLVHGKTCCIFSEYNEAAEMLARDLVRRDPKRKIFFCSTPDDNTGKYTGPAKKYLFTSIDVVDTVKAAAGSKREYAGTIWVFLVSEDVMKNYSAARDMQDIPVKIYCRGMETELLPGAEFFDDSDCCARQYWQAHPLEKDERVILLTGDGPLARKLFSRAVTVNCRLPFASSSYHLFGDWTEFKNFHPALLKAFAQNREEEGRDSVYFHTEDWNQEENLLRSADRIIFCGEDEVQNVKYAAMTAKYFSVDAQVHIASSGGGSGKYFFGNAQELFTEENVLHNALDNRARMLHESYCESVGDTEHPWEGLRAFLKESNRSAADHMMTKIRLLLPDQQPLEADAAACREAFKRWQNDPDKDRYRRNEHERWRRFHLFYNWQYGEKKDAAKRTHPCLMEYEKLPDAEKKKDDNAWEQIGLMARLLEEERK